MAKAGFLAKNGHPEGKGVENLPNGANFLRQEANLLRRGVSFLGRGVNFLRFGAHFFPRQGRPFGRGGYFLRHGVSLKSYGVNFLRDGVRPFWWKNHFLSLGVRFLRFRKSFLEHLRSDPGQPASRLGRGGELMGKKAARPRLASLPMTQNLFARPSYHEDSCKKITRTGQAEFEFSRDFRQRHQPFSIKAERGLEPGRWPGLLAVRRLRGLPVAKNRWQL